ncbi:MAG: acyl transferase [Bacteroidetes bacterium]|nr:acyl transferase [Bacteroidota bacterium]
MVFNKFEDIITNLTVSSFNETAIQLFRFQYKNNKIYRQFVDLNNININKVKSTEEIPFLPIEFFKSKVVVCGDEIPENYFESSGTSGIDKSKHYIKNLEIYEKSFLQCFTDFYGNISDYCLLAILPNYAEQQHSSLIYMIKKLIEKTTAPESGFYLYDLEKLAEKLNELKRRHQKIILFGVSYALLDLAEQYPLNLSGSIIFETGGMKGRRKELLREELHLKLQTAFNVKTIHGEYGMTELFSQAYSDGYGFYKCPPWMKVMIRDTNDPKNIIGFNKTGGINVIDLANIYSCSFIATQDLGKLYENNSFEVLGRFDNSDIRGCNLMIE